MKSRAGITGEGIALRIGAGASERLEPSPTASQSSPKRSYVYAHYDEKRTPFSLRRQLWVFGIYGVVPGEAITSSRCRNILHAAHGIWTFQYRAMNNRLNIMGFYVLGVNIAFCFIKAEEMAFDKSGWR
ncbi:hypothetical protein [Accumulibacter sp.]|uniref:hypothetical protein n=1 Tax=Accumulibacter sp. TaxID=2053492 RepID=UPI0026367FB0|nr:hypothetical protein [Accumulibacter sp.]